MAPGPDSLPPLPAETLAAQRAALAALLDGLLGPEAVAAALGVWTRDYSHRPGVLRAYAACLVREFGVGLELREMHRLLVQHLLLTETRRGPDASGVPAPPAAATRSVPPLTRAFALLVDALLQRCAQQAPKQAEALRRLLIAEAAAARLERGAQDLLVTWLESGGPVPGVVYPEDRLRELVHAAWTMLCEDSGPLAADRLLAAAVHAAEEQSADVRRLL